MSPTNLVDTRTRLLDAGEELFAAKGFAAVSLRDLTGLAGANLAAVNYHFRDKAELFREVVRRRAGGLNDRRLQLLDSAGDDPSVEEVTEAFVRPAIEMTAFEPVSKSGFCCLLGRALLEEPELAVPLVREVFQPVFERFILAFTKACPEIDKVSLWWRVHCLAGAMLHTLMHRKDLEAWSGGMVKGDDCDQMVFQIVASTAPGFRAAQPASRPLPKQAGRRTVKSRPVDSRR